MDRIERKTPYWVYFCPDQYKEVVSPDCPRTIGVSKADEIVWRRVCNAISNPHVLLGDTCLHMSEIQLQAEKVLDNKDQLQRDLDAVVLERKKVITWARKGVKLMRTWSIN